jgi:RNA polymerase sigma factor (sigma-70 family)
MQGAEPDVEPGGVLTPEGLAEAYAPVVYRFSVMLCRSPDEADDLAQDVLVRAMGRLDRFDPARGPVEAWLWQIALSVARDARRAARRTGGLVERLLAMTLRTTAPPAELVALDHLRDAGVMAALRTLSRRHRTLIALRFGAQLSFLEIAAITGKNEQAVKQATYRALAALRARLEDVQ